MNSKTLFHDGTLSAVISNRTALVKKNVDSIPKDQFLVIPEDLLVENLLSSLTIQQITLHEASRSLAEMEVDIAVNDYGRQIIVPGIRVTVSIPFSGDFDLWSLKPSSFKTVLPHGNIKNPGSDGIGYLDIIIEQSINEELEKIRRALDEDLRNIRWYLDRQGEEIERFNNALPNLIIQAIQGRRDRLKRHNDAVEFLEIPLKHKEGVQETRPIEIKRKLVRPLPQIPKDGYKAEPGITEEDYEHILSVIRHEGRTFETTPKTYAVHDEEELRDIIIAHLNGHYQGGATGEAFRLKGKTDIRIEDADRAAFIAECKIWRGAKELNDAIDQLLGYLTWRDCKAAIVIFNKENAKFTELLGKVPETLALHPNVKSDLGQKSAGEWRHVFASREDELRRICIHVFLFNLYVR